MPFAFGADDSNRLVDSKACFDAHDQQIKHVGELSRDSVLTFARASSEDIAGHEDSEPHASEGEQQRLRRARMHDQSYQEAERAAANRQQYPSDLIGLRRA